MNSRGVLFTLMAVAMLLSVLSLNYVSRQNQISAENNTAQLSSLINTGNKYSEIYSEIVDLGKEGVAKTIYQRIVPFDYVIDANSLLISYNLPANQSVIDNYFSIINSYAIFISDTNYLTTYSGVDVDINTTKNFTWLGTQNTLSFNILPQCMELVLEDTTSLTIQESNAASCAGIFSQDSLISFDINILLKKPTSDYNSVGCSFSGVADCPQNTFNPLSTDPFISIEILDSLCRKCSLSDQNTTISTHYNPYADNNIVIECIQAGAEPCASEPITIILGTPLTISAAADRTDLNISLTLTQPVEQLTFKDVNFSVYKEDFDILQTSTN